VLELAWHKPSLAPIVKARYPRVLMTGQDPFSEPVGIFQTEGTSGSPWDGRPIGDGRVCFHANQVELVVFVVVKARQPQNAGAIRRCRVGPGVACKMFLQILRSLLFETLPPAR